MVKGKTQQVLGQLVQQMTYSEPYSFESAGFSVHQRNQQFKDQLRNFLSQVTQTNFGERTTHNIKLTSPEADLLVQVFDAWGLLCSREVYSPEPMGIIPNATLWTIFKAKIKGELVIFIPVCVEREFKQGKPSVIDHAGQLAPLAAREIQQIQFELSRILNLGVGVEIGVMDTLIGSIRPEEVLEQANIDQFTASVKTIFDWLEITAVYRFSNRAHYQRFVNEAVSALGSNFEGLDMPEKERFITGKTRWYQERGVVTHNIIKHITVFVASYAACGKILEELGEVILINVQSPTNRVYLPWFYSLMRENPLPCLWVIQHHRRDNGW